jgi:hypothetical protein
MKLTILVILVLATQDLLSQVGDKKLFTLEYHGGFNANAYTFDDIAKPFLDEGLGRYHSIDINWIVPTRKGRVLQFSGSMRYISLVTSPSNLKYEFGYTYNDDCCLRLPGFFTYTGGIKYGLPIYRTEKLEILGALGAGLNIDIATTEGVVAYEGRRLWVHSDNKRGPAIFPSFDLSTRLIYHLNDNFLVTASLSLIHAPFYSLDYTYVINSRDGTFVGLFHQKLSSATLGLGLGIKL